jgi:hypothetical protein
MQFLFPLFLSAAVLISIPILIHLFYFRRFKKVYFTNVRFLKELKEETTSRSKIRNLLVLLMRIMAILFLVIAFAQPFIRQDETDSPQARTVGIFIDNSFSMNALSADVALIEVAKQRAREIIEAYEETDRFLITTNDVVARYERLVDKNTAREFVEEIEIGPSSKAFSQVSEYMKRQLDKEKNTKPVSYFISDFQKQQADLQSDVDMEINLIPIKAVQERNLSIDSVWFESPVQMSGQIARLLIKCSNYDSNPVENARISYQYEGENKPIGSVNIAANSSVTDTISFLVKGTGWQEMVLEITDYPIEFDDLYHIAFEVPDKLPVLIIQENAINRFLRAAFSSNAYYEPSFQSVDKVSYSDLPNQRLIILDGISKLSSGLVSELNGYLERGGNIIWFPPAQNRLEELNKSLQSLNLPPFSAYEQGAFEGFKLNNQSFVYRDVFERIPDNLKLPNSKIRYKSGSGRGENIISFRDGSNMLTAYENKKGIVYVVSVPLDPTASNFASSAEVFIPLLFRVPLQRREALPWSYTIGRDEALEVSLPPLRGDVSFKMKGPIEFIPSISRLGSKVVLNMHHQITEHGIYRLISNEDQDIAVFAFNYDRRESDPKSYTSSELTAMYPSYQIMDYSINLELASIISQQTKGTVLWRIALLIGLLFILAEILLLRFWKV